MSPDTPDHETSPLSVDHDITLAQAQAAVDRWVTTIGGGYFSPLTNMALLTEEVGELARIIARRFGDQRAKAGDDISPAATADELADIMWVTMALANQTGVDLSKALADNIAKKTSRDRHRFTP